MKKTLLLSVAASALIMAGGDIAPVEPAVAAPAVSGWDFSGTATLYYQTVGSDFFGTDLFEQDTAAANAGIQLRATNSDVVAGIGAGIELSGLATLDLEKDVVATPMQLPNSTDLTGGWISQAYLTYGFGNTSIKVGRQELPKALSPLAFSEKWNITANTYDAVVVVNSDLPDTTAVLAYVKRANTNEQLLFAGIPFVSPLVTLGFSPAMNDFGTLGGVYMLTLQNKSIENVTLTGSYYTSNDLLGFGIDLDAYWVDAQIAAGDFTVGLQGGNIDMGIQDMTAFGAKVATAFDGVDVALAYSHTDDGFMINVGGTTSALYTSTAGNQLLGNYLMETNSDKWLLSAGTEALGGNLSGAVAITDSDMTGDTTELDVVYSTSITDSVNLTAAYVYLDTDVLGETVDVIRVVGTYNF